MRRTQIVRTDKGYVTGPVGGRRPQVGGRRLVRSQSRKVAGCNLQVAGRKAEQGSERLQARPGQVTDGKVVI